MYLEEKSEEEILSCIFLFSSHHLWTAYGRHFFYTNVFDVQELRYDDEGIAAIQLLYKD